MTPIDRGAIISLNQDIDPVFLNLAKRLTQLSKTNCNGLSVITLAVFVMDGKPVQYTRPEVNNLATLEPKGNADTFYDDLKKLRR